MRIDGPHKKGGFDKWGFVFDGDDEDGDPSGFYFLIAGWSLGIYWPMHIKVMVTWNPSERLLPMWHDLRITDY